MADTVSTSDDVENYDYCSTQLYVDERDKEVEEKMFRYLYRTSIPSPAYLEMSEMWRQGAQLPIAV